MLGETPFDALVAYSMKQSLWEANLFSASQEIPRILWDPKVHYCISAYHLSLSWARLILTFHVPNLVSLFHRLGCTKVSVQVRGMCMFHDCQFLRWGVVSSTSPNPQARPPLVSCPWLLIHYIHSYPPYWRLFIHPQPKDMLCRGDRDQLIMVKH